LFEKGFSGYECKSKFKRITNVWTDIPEQLVKDKAVKFHYTPKPEKAIERIILSHTSKGDIVLDPFMGSGTTGLVSKRLSRDFIGFD